MDEKIIAAVGAYWGDGTKSLTGCLEFTNSEPELVKLFIKMMKDVYTVLPSEIKYKIKIHENVLNKNAEETIVKRWSSILKIAPTMIRFATVKNRKQTTLLTRLPENFGSMQVRHYRKDNYQKLLKLMNEIISMAFTEKWVAINLTKGLLAADGYVHRSRTDKIQEITIAEKSECEKLRIRKVLDCIGIKSHVKNGHGSAVVIYGYENFKIFKELGLFSYAPKKLKKFLSLY